ncbi:MAG: hypothetical protein N6V49_13725 [Serratia symbiotica]|nr:hypothetical protein [Serratia symbiotica]
MHITLLLLLLLLLLFYFFLNWVALFGIVWHALLWKTGGDEERK